MNRFILFGGYATTKRLNSACTDVQARESTLESAIDKAKDLKLDWFDVLDTKTGYFYDETGERVVYL